MRLHDLPKLDLLFLPEKLHFFDLQSHLLFFRFFIQANEVFLRLLMNSQPQMRSLLYLILCIKLARWRQLISALDFNELHLQLLT